MPNELFVDHFPEIAETTTRTLTLFEESRGVPVGKYEFVEAYCTEPGCDCRRVMLRVLKDRKTWVAGVAYGFDRTEDLCGPYFDPLNPIPPYADGLMTLMKQHLFSDPAYVARLVKHYEMMKVKTNPKPPTSPAARAESRKKKKKKNRDKKHWPPA